MKEEIIIRPAIENDLPQILEIYNEAILHTTAVYDYEPHTLQMHKEWFQEKQQHGFPVFVAEYNEIIAGFSSFGPFRRQWTAYKFSVENSIYIKEDFRGEGIGKLLMHPLIASAREMNFHTMIAGIDATNEISIALRKQFGFVEAAHFKEVGFKFERWLDLKFLQLIL